MKKSRKRAIGMFLGCLASGILGLMPLETAFSAWAAESSPKTVKVGYYQARDFQEGDGGEQLRSGYSYEYLQKVNSYTGWRYEYVPGSWDELYQELLDGKIDLLPGVLYSEERKDQILYPDYEMLYETLYIYKNHADTSMRRDDLGSLAGKKIGVVRDEKTLSSVKNWMKEKNVDLDVKIYPDLETCALDFNRGALDGFVSADNLVSGYTGITPLEVVGKEPYYIGVAKDRTDLLEELDQALSVMTELDSLYLETLKNKYSADTSVSVFISRQEQDWMEAHPVIIMGYLDNYLPYSDTDSEGEVTGLVKNLIPDIFESLPGDYKPQIQYRKYIHQMEMLEALERDEVDLVFPVGGEMQYAETEGYQQSSPVMSASADLVYQGEYGSTTTARMAVNRENQLQEYYTRTNFPDAQIVYCGSIEECIKKIKNGQADSTIVNAFRVVKLVGADSTMNVLPLDKSNSICFGVDFGNIALLRILNHGVSILGEGYATNYAYQYLSSLVVYTADDFIKEHMELVYGLAVVLILVVIAFTAMRYRNMRKIARREAEQKEKLEEALRKAQEANYAKQVFLNNMSHDVRTPLNGILGILEINSKCKDPQILEDNRKKAREAVYQLLALVNEVIEMSKLEKTDQRPKTEIMNLQTASETVKRSIALQAEMAGLTLKYERKGMEGEWPLVYGSALHLREVLQHILENAVKYNKPGGTICWTDQLSCGQDGVLCYECTVEDTGIGMRKEYLDHIFKPFTQGNEDARTVYKGTGLGMTIVKTLVEQMNGTIGIESQLGEGTKVSLRIPFQAVQKEEIQKNEDRRAAGMVSMESASEVLDAFVESTEEDLSGMRILLVEDNDLNVEIGRYILEDAGASVTVARNGEEALEIYLNQPAGGFHAILMDIMMPVMDGYEAAKAIRFSAKPDASTIPIIATTACVSENSRVASEDAGINEFLEKPLDLKKLLVVLRKYKK